MSDGGNNVFRVTLELKAFDGLQFQLNRRERTLRNVDKSGEKGENCDVDLCSQVTLFGVPILLMRILNDLTISVPTNPAAADPRLNLNVIAGNNSTSGVGTVRFEIVKLEQKASINIALVAGLGVFLLTVLTIIRITTSRTSVRTWNKLPRPYRFINRNRYSTGSGYLFEEPTQTREHESWSFYEDNEVERPQRRFRFSSDGDIFDWEKHIDNETGEVYFFNPKTGEARRDPPTVRNYGV